METFLVCFTYLTAKDWVIAQMQDQPACEAESTTAIRIRATSAADALRWGEDVAARFMDYVNEGGFRGWRDAGCRCWIASAQEAAELTGTLAFFQQIRDGQSPEFAKMTTDAYVEWLEQCDGPPD